MVKPLHPLLVVAVSGGVDSVVLLHQLIQAGQPLVVAHVDHGIRATSREDEAFVRELAARYDVPFVSTTLELGAEASEDTARQARYAWLEKMRVHHSASAIATAHHEDDVLETIVINIARGTGWRGLCSLRETSQRYRPLLTWSKAQIVAYAIEHNLEWREDETNESLSYLRNRIRHLVIPRLSSTDRKKMVDLHTSQLTLRQEIEQEISRLNQQYCHETTIGRYPLVTVPDDVAYELLRAWLGTSLELSRMRDLLLFVKTARLYAKWSLDAHRFIVMKQGRLIVQSSRD